MRRPRLISAAYACGEWIFVRLDAVPLKPLQDAPSRAGQDPCHVVGSGGGSGEKRPGSERGPA